MQKPKVNFIGMTNTITVENRTGHVEMFTQICDMEVTDEELLQIKQVQQETAEKLETIFNK